jgi:hypothetical protein
MALRRGRERGREARRRSDRRRCGCGWGWTEREDQDVAQAIQFVAALPAPGCWWVLLGAAAPRPFCRVRAVPRIEMQTLPPSPPPSQFQPSLTSLASNPVPDPGSGQNCLNTLDPLSLVKTSVNYYSKQRPLFLSTFGVEFNNFNFNFSRLKRHLAPLRLSDVLYCTYLPIWCHFVESCLRHFRIVVSSAASQAGRE